MSKTRYSADEASARGFQDRHVDPRVAHDHLGPAGAAPIARDNQIAVDVNAVGKVDQMGRVCAGCLLGFRLPRLRHGFSLYPRLRIGRAIVPATGVPRHRAAALRRDPPKSVPRFPADSRGR